MEHTWLLETEAGADDVAEAITNHLHLHAVPVFIRSWELIYYLLADFSNLSH